MKIELKEIKIIAIILAIIGFWFKAKKSGENKEKLKQFESNEKIIKKRKNIKHITSRKHLSNKLRKHKF